MQDASAFHLVVSDDEWTGTLAVPRAYHEAGLVQADWYRKEGYT